MQTEFSSGFINERLFKTLGVTSRQRNWEFPDLPTISEAGVPDFEVTNW